MILRSVDMNEPVGSSISADRVYDFFVSPTAARKIRESLIKRKTPKASLRVGVRGGGCSGFSYVIEFADDPPREGRDLVYMVPVDDGEVRVICDRKSIIYLSGTTLEWEKTLKWEGFKFVNPNATGTCGCNESFSI